jgi:small conductance mechanosensitive channel
MIEDRTEGCACRRGRTWSAALALVLLLGHFCGEATAQAGGDSLATVGELTSRSMPDRAWLFVEELFDLSAGNLRDKGLRIAIIALIVALARLAVYLVQKMSHLVVYSTWGPLKYAFRDHQRAITLHNLLLSLTKYVVYFTALGYILAELGIDYRAYLASLSLIGIAIGFGAQGLVQDVVTGFFILFEDQFAVGDMVEISGQVGTVESIGLRTTRIRNYFGAHVVLQNRNIPLASRYPRGGFEAVVDVAIASKEASQLAGEWLQKIGEELHRQFQEIILEKPRVQGLVELETGEVFLRLYCKIWPAQQWVIDGQLVPRIREIFKRQGLEIPGDRVLSFYHLPEEKIQGQGLLRRLGLAGQYE